MADDIDDLLDEVESKFCANSPQKSASKSSLQRNRTPTSASGEELSNKKSQKRVTPRKGTDDLNDIIRDICDDDGLDVPVSPAPALAAASSRGNTETSSHKSKCFNLYLGGTRISKGICTMSGERSCDQLRCTSCDFKVVMFDNYVWDKDCDYLFLRNNVPDFQKLRSKLVTKRGSRAYACQCSWRSVDELVDIQTDAKLKWVCGKHS